MADFIRGGALQNNLPNSPIMDYRALAALGVNDQFTNTSPVPINGIPIINLQLGTRDTFADKQTNSFGWNPTTLDAVGQGIQGIGQLATGWAALKGAKLAREQLAQNQAQYLQNYNAQKTVINNAINNQNAWKSAQGRTDLANLVV